MLKTQFLQWIYFVVKCEESKERENEIAREKEKIQEIAREKERNVFQA